MSLDDALEKLGSCGRYQILTYIIIGVSAGLTIYWQLFAIVFIGFINPHTCVNDSVSGNDLVLNEGETLLSQSVAVQRTEPQNCLKQVNYTVSNSLGVQEKRFKNQIPCHNFSYDPYVFDANKGTIVMEWDLVCDKNWWVELSQTLFNFGVVVGFFSFTPFADKYGRKKVFFICQLFMVICGTIMSFSPHFAMLCAMQFLTGACAAGEYVTGLVLACEIFPYRLRAFLAPLTVVFFSIGMCTLSLWAFLLRHWRDLQLGVSVGGAIFLIYFWFCPESLRWLVIKRRFDQADKILKTAAKFNKVDLPANILDDERNSTEDKDKDTMLDFFRSPKPRRYVVIMMYLVFGNQLMYFGLSLLTGALQGNIYVIFAINGVLEIPAVILTVVCMHYFGRRPVLCFCHIASGAAIILIAALEGVYLNRDRSGDHIIDQVIIGFAFVAKFFVAGAYGVELVYAQEIFPTNLRASGLGVTSGAGFVGAILAPFSVYLYRIIPWVPLLVFGIISITGGFAVMLVVETVGRDLPRSVAMVASWPRTLTKEEKAARNVSLPCLSRQRENESTNIAKVTPQDESKPKVSNGVASTSPSDIPLQDSKKGIDNLAFNIKL